MVFGRLKRRLRKGDEEYIEVDLGQEIKKEKVMVRPFVLKKFDDVNEVLNALREGYNIVVIDIKQMKGKDMMDLKRAILKIKKTVEAIEGDIAGFGENIIIATPSFAQVYKPKKPSFNSPQKQEDKYLEL
ncbi:MAG: cell division protein SepF [Candidatus Pacearchaeota archaeon]